MPQRLLKSLTVKQAVLAVVTAFLIGLVLTMVELGWTGWREREKVLGQTREIFTMAQGPATAAAWDLDQDLGAQVLLGILAIDAVRDATIETEQGAVIAQRHRDRPQRGPFAQWIGDFLFADIVSAERPLSIAVAGGNRRDVGRLRMTLDAGILAGDFLAFSATQLLGGVARQLLLGLALVLVFHRFLTRPLIQIGRAVTRIDPEQPLDNPVPVPRGHDDDELGYVVRRFNQTLARLDREQQELRQLATRCSLTGLANRTLLIDRLTHAINQARQDGRPLAVLFLDLDRFKHVNDSLGHEAGDNLLRMVGARLLDSVPPTDTVGRLGGDEFLLVCERIREPSDAASIAERILKRLGKPMFIGDNMIHVSTSIGIALFPSDGTDAQSLMRMADVAMYAAKSAGTGRFVFYRRDMTERAMVRLRTEASLREASDRGEFELFFQPKVAAKTGELMGFEALIRWRLAGRLIPPMDFIPIAEDTGLINSIGDWVIDAACQTIARWQAKASALPLAVNVSAQQLTDTGFPGRVAAALQRHRIDPALLELEITETVLMQDVLSNMAVLEKLRAIGTRIAIDDFGTGYSSLSYLRRLPIDVLKIDQSFVADLPNEPAIAATVIMLAQRMDLKTVAEGVETVEQRNWLAEAGCDLLQGYLIARPMPLAEAEQLLRTRRVRGAA
ncbi:MAG: EAL domain-containing protein [Azospirillaceae bacterium]|nr:EAL domain-containing protein [Azospirillaceae bacterium]